MISTLISRKRSATKVKNLVQTLDMTTEINSLISDLEQQKKWADKSARRAAIMRTTNPHTKTITLLCTDFGNISLKAPHVSPTAPTLYSIPGQTILFAINKQSFVVQLYAIKDDRLISKEAVIISEGNPLHIDGRRTLFDANPMGQGHQAFIGSINLPRRSADISVFDRASLRKIAWFPHDDSSARYLVSLELLQSVQDPHTCKVAQELIHHYHPAVAWQAFQLMHQADRQAAQRYVPLLRKLENPRLNDLLDLQSKAA